MGKSLVPTTRMALSRAAPRLSAIPTPASSSSSFLHRRFFSSDSSTPSADSKSDDKKVIYIGPANGNIRFIKRIAAATVFAFGVVYPASALLMKVGTATYGLGSRLLFSVLGATFSGGLCALLHKFTKGYIVSISTSPSKPNIWSAQVFGPFGGVREVDIDLADVKPSLSKYFQFNAKGVDYFVLFSLFEDKKKWVEMGLPLTGDDVLSAREAGVKIDEQKVLEEESKRDASVFKP